MPPTKRSLPLLTRLRAEGFASLVARVGIARFDLADSADFTQIRAPDIRRQVGEIYASNRFWPEFEPVAQVQALGYSRVCAASND
jgi:hypothetical protein